MNGEIREWLSRFEATVRVCDFDTARALFAADAIAFGTRAEKAEGLDRIAADQWQHVWPHIRDFRLRDPVVQVHGDMAWIATIWETARPERSRAPRCGRGTFVLERRDGRWLAVHSHFSLVPEDPQL